MIGRVLVPDSPDAAVAIAVVPQVKGLSWWESLGLAYNSDKSRIYLCGTMNFAASFDPTDAFASSKFRPYIAAYDSNLVLDTSFGVGGYAFLEDFQINGDSTLTPVVRDWEGTGLTVGPDGKIYLSFIYYKDVSGTTTWTYGVARFNPNGTIDDTFATDGMYLSAFPSGAGYSPQTKVRIQSNGGVIVATLYALGGGYTMQLVRLTSSGTVDTGFQQGAGPPGSSSTFFLYKVNAQYGFGFEIQSDDKIVFGVGITQSGSDKRFWVTRINGATGVYDSSFGTSGITKVAFPQNLEASCECLILQGTSIIAAGQASNGSGDLALAMCRLDSSGTLDATFGTSGLVLVSSGFQDNDQVAPEGVFLDGTKIVVFGFTMSDSAQYYTPVRQGFVARFDADGALDTTFGPSLTGFILIPFWSGDISQNEELYAAFCLSSDEYIFAGHANASTTTAARAYIAKMVGDNFAAALTVQSGTAPTVTTGAASSVGTTTATANATINPNGNTTIWLFQYGLASGLYSARSSSASAGSGSSGVGLTAALTGLTTGTTYYGRAAAWSVAAGLSLGDEISFTTS